MESSLTSGFYERVEGYRTTVTSSRQWFSVCSALFDFDRFRHSKGLRSSSVQALAAPIADFSFVTARLRRVKRRCHRLWVNCRWFRSATERFRTTAVSPRGSLLRYSGQMDL